MAKPGFRPDFLEARRQGTTSRTLAGTYGGVMGAASLVRPSQNPAFNLPDYFVVRLAGRTLSEAHLEHPEEPDHGIKSVLPLREAALNVLI